MRPVKEVMFRGKIWKLKFAAPDTVSKLASAEAKRTGDPLTRVDGLTDHPATKRKSIHITTGQVSRNELDACIHEGLHASMWDVGEDAVTETARDIARFLWRLGWRRSSG